MSHIYECPDCGGVAEQEAALCNPQLIVVGDECARPVNRDRSREQMCIEMKIVADHCCEGCARPSGEPALLCAPTYTRA